MSELRLSRDEFDKHIRWIASIAIEFDELRGTYPDEDNIPDELSILRDDCLAGMVDFVVDASVPNNKNIFIEYISECMVNYFWAIDGSKDSIPSMCSNIITGNSITAFDYDYYTNLVDDYINVAFENPQDFKNSSLYKMSMGITSCYDFYDLLNMALNYSYERI